jgi:hypothetical protein
MIKNALTTCLGLLGALVTTAVVLSCNVTQPQPGDDNKETKFAHADFTEKNACTDCHEKDRPTPGHGKGSDCRVCHDSNDDKSAVFVPKDGITSSGDSGDKTDTASDTSTGTGNDSSKVFQHEANLTSCASCHEKDRAPPPHVKTGDCVACHDSNNVGAPWKPK